MSISLYHFHVNDTKLHHLLIELISLHFDIKRFDIKRLRRTNKKILWYNNGLKRISTCKEYWIQNIAMLLYNLNVMLLNCNKCFYKISKYFWRHSLKTLLTLTKEILNKKFHFLYSGNCKMAWKMLSPKKSLGLVMKFLKQMDHSLNCKQCLAHTLYEIY